MICPNKKCLIEIDDDSKFCDQCGSEILFCPKCNTPGTGKFCAKDGTRLESRRSDDTQNATPQQGTLPESQGQTAGNAEQPHEIPQGGTAAFDLNSGTGSDAVTLIHSGGLELVIKNSDILGRGEGAHAVQLQGFKFLSRKHAELILRSGSWFIKDLGSTNKSKLNGEFLEPQREYPVKKGDCVMLADQEFTVK
jgi:hypothetical protein